MASGNRVKKLCELSTQEVVVSLLDSPFFSPLFSLLKTILLPHIKQMRAFIHTYCILSFSPFSYYGCFFTHRYFELVSPDLVHISSTPCPRYSQYTYILSRLIILKQLMLGLRLINRRAEASISCIDLLYTSYTSMKVNRFPSSSSILLYE